MKRKLKDIAVLAAIAALTAGAISILLEWRSRQASRRYIEVAAQRSAADFEAMAVRVEASLKMIREWGRNGLLDPADMQRSRDLLLPCFDGLAKLSGISVAEKDGPSFYLLRDGTLNDTRAEGRYNPEIRPWFRIDPEAARCFWTDVYRFKTLDEPGLSVSISWNGPHGRPVVAAFDILLDDFFNSVEQVAPTPSSRAFIFLPDGRLYVPESEGMHGRFLSTVASHDELLREGLALWQDESVWNDSERWNDHAGSGLKTTVARFGRDVWWCGFVPVEKSRRTVWMGIMVPESDLVGDRARQRTLYIAIGSIVFLAASAVYWIYVRRRDTAGLDLVPDEASILGLIEKGESETVEFKSTMRMNLHSRKPGKEIEQAWLKGVSAFLNTNGGTLLLGVTDAGEINGLEQDVFENADKCQLHFKNLIAKGLGVDVSKFIRFSVVPIGGKTVGVVQCVKASRPVYLRDGNKENFYIRNGPSSDALPASRMVDYISENWK